MYEEGDKYASNAIETSVHKFLWQPSSAAGRPAKTPFKKIVDTLEKHFSPKPSEIVERYKFHSRNRNEDEGVAAYVAELRKLTEHRNFGETLPEMLGDRLVCGINKKKIQRRLLAKES